MFLCAFTRLQVCSEHHCNYPDDTAGKEFLVIQPGNHSSTTESCVSGVSTDCQLLPDTSSVFLKCKVADLIPPPPPCVWTIKDDRIFLEHKVQLVPVMKGLNVRISSQQHQKIHQQSARWEMFDQPVRDTSEGFLTSLTPSIRSWINANLISFLISTRITMHLSF